MTKEWLDVFTENMEPIGVKPRADVHRDGDWHQTFQCWILTRDEGRDDIYFQERHASKADFPGLLDITAAGHLGAGETREAGVREIEEELGIRLSPDDLVYAGCVPGRYRRDGFIDNEFRHLHFYVCRGPAPRFRFQDGEAEAVVRIAFEDAKQLLRGEAESVSGVRCRPQAGEARLVTVRRTDLVPHETAYFETVIREAERLFAALATDR